MGKKKTNTTMIAVAVDAAARLLSSKDVQKKILGTYSNGKVRSLADALEGEFLSPKQREKMLQADIKKHKKKKKGGKKKKDKKRKKKLEYRFDLD